MLHFKQNPVHQFTTEFNYTKRKISPTNNYIIIIIWEYILKFDVNGEEHQVVGLLFNNVLAMKKKITLVFHLQRSSEKSNATHN